MNSAAPQVSSTTPLFVAPGDGLVTPLARAIATWKSGRRISTVLASELMSEGMDVNTLEDMYLTY